MKSKAIVSALALIALSICQAGKASAADAALESGSFNELALAVYKIPSDCSKIVNSDATLTHLRNYLTDQIGPFVKIDYSDVTPHLAVHVDCMKLEDTRGEGREIGYTLSILVQFYRPFYENITYVHASPWFATSLTYYPAVKITQAVFEEELDLMLEEFVALWLKEHNAIPKPDEMR